MNREEAIKKVSELSCPYQHLCMTECPHCADEVESMIKIFMEVKESTHGGTMFLSNG